MMPMQSLANIFQELAEFIPGLKDDESDFLQLGPDNLPIPPDQLATDGICLTASHHFYNDVPVEAISLESEKPSLCHLGLLILSTLFHRNPPRVVVNLEHQRSTVRKLIVGYDWDEAPDHPGLIVRPERFNFYPTAMSRHPWIHHAIVPYDLPILYLTNRRELVVSADELADRDVAVGFGNLEGSTLFAELLLNGGRPSSSQLEFHLESELGCRGVGPGSTEIKIWLPGSIGNLDHEPLGV